MWPQGHLQNNVVTIFLKILSTLNFDYATHPACASPGTGVLCQASCARRQGHVGEGQPPCPSASPNLRGRRIHSRKVFLSEGEACFCRRLPALLSTPPPPRHVPPSPLGTVRVSFPEDTCVRLRYAQTYSPRCSNSRTVISSPNFLFRPGLLHSPLLPPTASKISNQATRSLAMN